MLTTEASDDQIRGEAMRVFRGLPWDWGRTMDRVAVLLMGPEPVFDPDAYTAEAVSAHRVTVDVVRKAEPTRRGIRRWVEMGEVHR